MLFPPASLLPFRVVHRHRDRHRHRRTVRATRTTAFSTIPCRRCTVRLVIVSLISSPFQPVENISEIVAQRLEAVKKLQANPNDGEAMALLAKAEEQVSALNVIVCASFQRVQMKAWAASKNLPGQFNGSTGVTPLTREQLGPNDRKYEAWVRRVSVSVHLVFLHVVCRRRQVGEVSRQWVTSPSYEVHFGC